MTSRLLKAMIFSLALFPIVTIGSAQDEQEIEAAQDERESLRWAPERDIRTMQHRNQENQLELNRGERFLLRAVRDDRNAARGEVNQQKARVRDEEIKTRDAQVNASDKHQLDQATVEQARRIQDAVGFSGKQMIDLGLQQSQLNRGNISETNRKRKEIRFLKEQEGFLMNEQRRLEVLGEPDEAESLEGEVGAVQNRLKNLRKPPSTFIPGMPLGNPSSGQNTEQ